MAITIPGMDLQYWGKLELTTAPTSELITTAEAKTHLRIDSSFTDDDAYIDALIIAAREIVEAHTRIKWAGAEYTLWFDEFPATDIITINDIGYARTAAVKYFDTDGVEQTLNTSKFTLQGQTIPPRIWLKETASWPETRTDGPGVKIELEVGYTATTGNATPGPILAAMKLIIGHLYENRQDVVDRIQYTMPQGAAYLIQPFRDLSA